MTDMARESFVITSGTAKSALPKASAPEACRNYGVGFRIFRVYGRGFRVEVLGFEVCRVEGSGVMAGVLGFKG